MADITDMRGGETMDSKEDGQITDDGALEDPTSLETDDQDDGDGDGIDDADGDGDGDDMIVDATHDPATVNPNQHVFNELISARLCILKKWPNFKSYGFSLHNIGEYEQQIGTVDEGSPAKYAGLQVDDRIIEINFENVQGKSHSEMVRLIQTNLQQVKLLVVTKDAYQLMKDTECSVSSLDDSVEWIVGPERQPSSEDIFIPQDTVEEYSMSIQKESLNLPAHFSTSLKAMRQDRKYCDAAIAGKDYAEDKTKMLYIHRIVLASQSLVFHKLFQTYGEKKSVMSFSNITTDDLEVIVRYMYGERAFNEQEMAILKDTARLLKIESANEFVALQSRKLVHVPVRDVAQNQHGKTEVAKMRENEGNDLPLLDQIKEEPDTEVDTATVTNTNTQTDDDDNDDVIILDEHGYSQDKSVGKRKRKDVHNGVPKRPTTVDLVEIASSAIVCDYCQARFTSNYDLYTHRQSCVRRIQCRYCHVIVPEHYDLLKHYYHEHNTEDYNFCTLCGEDLYSETTVERHYESHQVGVRYFLLKKLSHVITKDTISEYPNLQTALNNDNHDTYLHFVKHWLKTLFYCPHCKMQYNAVDYLVNDLKQHILDEDVKYPNAYVDQEPKGKKKNSRHEPFQCKFCPKTFSTTRYFTQHLNQVHNVPMGPADRKRNGMAKLLCDICIKTFESRVGFENHMKKHEKEYKFATKVYKNFHKNIESLRFEDGDLKEAKDM